MQIKAASRDVPRLKAGLTTTTAGAIVMATRSLSAKQVQERLQRHRSAVAVLAMQSARREVKAQIRAQGLKVAHHSAKEISILAEAHLAQHREQLRAEAEHAINTWPGFARWRLPNCSNIETDAQSEN